VATFVIAVAIADFAVAIVVAIVAVVVVAIAFAIVVVVVAIAVVVEEAVVAIDGVVVVDLVVVVDRIELVGSKVAQWRWLAVTDVELVATELAIAVVGLTKDTVVAIVVVVVGLSNPIVAETAERIIVFDVPFWFVVCLFQPNQTACRFVAPFGSSSSRCV
jgi:hypothetical protein